MINLYLTQIESLSIHRIGNKSKNEGTFFSEQPYQLNDELNELLKEFFFRPFREKEENYFRIENEVDLEYNKHYKIETEVFDNPNSIHEQSQKITKHLYGQSNHPHIKSGEVYVAYLSDVVVDNEKMNAIGIFKSELRSEEHTSELQSRENLVCRLLLEKKK